jgi:hypothetical protein
MFQKEGLDARVAIQNVNQFRAAVTAKSDDADRGMS